MAPPIADEGSLDRDLAELLDIRRRLDKSVGFDERITLSERQRELRSRWVTGYETMSADRLADLEKALLAQRDDVLNRHLDHSSAGNGGGEGGGGLDPLATIEHNRSVDEAHGRAEIEGRLTGVRAEIRRRKDL